MENKTVAILGSTGSIGTQALEVCDECGFKVSALGANSNIELLEKQIRKYKPDYCAVGDEKKAQELRTRVADTGVRVLGGFDGICTVAYEAKADILLNSLMGKCGIRPTLYAIDSGKNLRGVDWLTIKNGRVVDVDLKKYPVAVTRQKAAPAFDKLDLSSAENDEFGTASNEPKHFSKVLFSENLADENLIRLLNPLNFIGRNDVKAAKYFRIRAGSADRDTALAIPAILALKLQESGADVDFFSPWGVGHAGDYDLDKLFDWIDSICK